MLLLFDSLAAIVDGVEQWSRLLPILTRLKNRNRVRMLGMGRGLVLTVQYPLSAR